MAKKVICDRCYSDMTDDEPCEDFCALMGDSGGFFVAKKDLCHSCLCGIASACAPLPRLARS